tara:strand:+ start:17 stop:751 length:735 start_codon:yes stop_codon:yes gene_type:complete
MLKRIFDFVSSLIGIIILSPILLVAMFLIWKQDFHSPFYIAKRVGKNGKLFNMFKLRTMVVNADKSGVDSTSENDKRITPVGLFIRKYKLDELTQLINILIGNMSLVGPRPNVKRETDIYTSIEKQILSVKPGITDIASLVFSDEGQILSVKEDPDIAYNQLIRPWKSRLALFYIKNQNLIFDIRIIILTLVAIINKKFAIKKLHRIMRKMKIEPELLEIVKREKELIPTPPPGKNEIVNSREF